MPGARAFLPQRRINLENPLFRTIGRAVYASDRLAPTDLLRDSEAENRYRMKKNYNAGRKRLYLPEYGRHIHQMVDGLLEISDRDERNRRARMVIDVMGNLNPLLRDTPDFTHKLWDHLFIMSDFKLDVDSPYPIPTHATLSPNPHRMKYPDKKIELKHYGKNVLNMLRSLEGADDPEAVQEVISNVARYMRTKSYEYNQELPNNEMIIKEIKKMTGGRITIDEVALNHIKSDYKQPFSARPKKGPYVKKTNRTPRSGQQRYTHAK